MPGKTGSGASAQAQARRKQEIKKLKPLEDGSIPTKASWAGRVQRIRDVISTWAGGLV